MSLDNILSYFVNYSVYIIQAIALCLLAIAGIVIYREVLKEPETGDLGDGSQLGQLEATLKKVLEQTKGQSFSMPMGEGGEVDELALEAARKEAQEAVQVEIKSLKKKLEEKDQEVSALKADSGDDGPDPELVSQIQDLEARLAEYEIIEDDIADLSIYKEENVRLKEELEALKAGGATAPVVEEESESVESGDVSAEELAEAEAIAKSAAAEAMKEMAAEDEKSDQVDQADEVVEEDPHAAVDAAMAAAMAELEGSKSEPEPEPAALEEKPAEQTPSDVVDEVVAAAIAEGLGSEFAPDANVAQDEEPAEEPIEAKAFELEPDAIAAEEEESSRPITEEKVKKTSESVTQEEPAQNTDDSAAVEEPDSEVVEPVHDDILAEFVAGSGAEGEGALSEDAVKQFTEASGNEEKPSAEAGEESESIDTSKMMEELADLNQAAEDADGDVSLDESMDVEKMAAEASALGGEN